MAVNLNLRTGKINPCHGLRTNTFSVYRFYYFVHVCLFIRFTQDYHLPGTHSGNEGQGSPEEREGQSAPRSHRDRGIPFHHIREHRVIPNQGFLPSSTGYPYCPILPTAFTQVRDGVCNDSRIWGLIIITLNFATAEPETDMQTSAFCLKREMQPTDQTPPPVIPLQLRSFFHWHFSAARQSFWLAFRHVENMETVAW